MNVKVSELMTKSVVRTEPHKTIDHVRKILERNRELLSRFRKGIS
jgi:hypothetical protein